ncbi:hypothetical protein CJ030_MR2G016454 [Morella rubra]|uniref:Uncharacterized protein n=1 Tax=Morella rubra TaxID=262757 RepID=A0A6A1WE70_9ROSI|nr:hypothetical protein CJ030_MR2G016454 [Morella rubra]
MEYLRGQPVAKERPVTLSDFDQLLYEEHSLYQLFKYQGFLHQLSWTEGFTRIDFPLYMFELIMDDAWGIKDNNLPYSVFLTQFLIQRGVVIYVMIDLDSRVGATVKTALQPLQEQVDKLSKDVQSSRMIKRSSGPLLKGSAQVAYLRNKAVVAHMTEVNEQLEEIKKTLDDFKTEADPQKIPGDIPDDMETFRDAVQP